MKSIWTTASVYLLLHHILIFTIHYSTRFLSLWLEGEQTWVVSVGPPSEKFNMVNNDHWRTLKCNFCGSVGKTNFTEHDMPDAINGFRDSVLVCKLHDCYCTLRKNSFSSSLLIKNYKRQAIAMVRLYVYENKPLQNAFKCL